MNNTLITVLHVTVTIYVIFPSNCGMLFSDLKGNNYVIPIHLYTFDISSKKKKNCEK